MCWIYGEPTFLDIPTIRDAAAAAGGNDDDGDADDCDNGDDKPQLYFFKHKR